jgi:hypothetical protein
MQLRYSALAGAILMSCQCCFAAALNRSNLIVTWAGYPSSFAQEYTPTGALVQSWQITGSFSTEYARDVGVDSAGNVIIYNGTFSPSLTILNPKTGAKTNHSFSGWNTVNDVTWGGLAVVEGYAYATDDQIGPDGANQNGLVRFSLADGSAQRFFAGRDTTSVGVGLNKMLYEIWPDTSPGQNQLDVIDPSTMTLVKTIGLPIGLSGVTADAAGNIFGTSGSKIYKLDNNGNILASLETGYALDNIKISLTGQLVSANNGGQIVLSSTDLSTFNEWTLNEPNAQLYASYAAFATPIPEPGFAVLGLLPIGAFFCRRRRK